MDGKEFTWSKKEEKYTMFVDDDGEGEATNESGLGFISVDNNSIEDIIYDYDILRKDDDAESEKNNERRNEKIPNKMKKFGKGLIIKKKKNW